MYSECHSTKYSTLRRALEGVKPRTDPEDCDCSVTLKMWPWQRYQFVSATWLRRWRGRRPVFDLDQPPRSPDRSDQLVRNMVYRRLAVGLVRSPARSRYLRWQCRWRNTSDVDDFQVSSRHALSCSGVFRIKQRGRTKLRRFRGG